MAEQVVTLNPGESKVVSFEAVPSVAKTYSVSVDGLTGSFVATEALAGWVLPTGHIDSNNKWAYPERAYDNDLKTFASTWGQHYYGEYIELTLGTPIECSKVRINGGSYDFPDFRGPNLSIDLHYDGAWHNIWSGLIPGAHYVPGNGFYIVEKVWVEKAIPAGTKLVDKARVKWNEDTSIYLYEFNFWCAG
ncbi:MAG TPA: hypothetical protein VMV84_05535 [Dehalococcoidales bacterium]|nr:hypothetical protein [Dehalococcoidales bacterium]